MSTVRRHLSREGSWCWREVPESHQLVRRDRERKHPVHAVDPSMSKLPQPPDGFQPAEDLFHALALLLTDQIPRVARGACVDRTASMLVILGDVRRHAQVSQVLDKTGRVIVLVTAERHA